MKNITNTPEVVTQNHQGGVSYYKDFLWQVCLQRKEIGNIPQISRNIGLQRNNNNDEKTMGKNKS